ncbi:unnamed protein product [Rhizophagus irregularis]|nr:unnamed protein product [Rhizophagus irregularis]
MVFYQISLNKLLRFIGTIIISILIIYSFFNDINNFNNRISKIEVISLPGNQKKIDVGYGDDYWILTENNELYHKSMMLQKFVYKRSDVLDFAVGLDGTVAYIDINNEVYVRSMNADWWYKIADGSYAHQTISICDYKTIFTTNDNFDFIKGVYDYKIDDKLDMYNWEYVDYYYTYYQVSCAFWDHSIWIRGSEEYAYLYKDNYTHIPRTEVELKQVKALSEQYAIGVDYSNNLWELTMGTWTWIRNNVKSATINYNGNIFYIDNTNIIVCFKRPPDRKQTTIDVNSFNKEVNLPFPNNTGIMKIDVGQGEDFWILTENYKLYHWNAIKRKFIRKAKDYEPIYDFSVGSDGTVIISDYYHDINIRSYIDSWNIIYGHYDNRNISICDLNKIFTTNNYMLFVGGYYKDIYFWDELDRNDYYQISCAFHDKSLWFIGYGHYIYLYVNKYRKIIRSEVPFKQIKALSEQHAIGIDYDYILWEYINGTWTWIRNNVRTASINYNGDIFYIDNDNFIYKIKYRKDHHTEQDKSCIGVVKRLPPDPNKLHSCYIHPFTEHIKAFIIILNIYDVNSFNKTQNFPFPDTTGIMKIDVGQGEDLWILTENYELYHWDGIERKFIRKAKDYGPIYDFSVGPDGLAVIVSRSPINNNVFIRSDIDSWEWIYGSDVRVPIISISNCDYNKIFTIEDRKLIVCNYDNAYSCDTLKYGIYNQISCAFNDKSLWFIGSGHYIYLYINKYIEIIRSEVPFKQIKALSEQHVIGIDYDSTLWEYINGTWTGISNNVKSASINYNDDIFYVDNDNIIYKISKN